MNESYARLHLADTCARLYNRGLTVSAGGNMSVRLSDEEIKARLSKVKIVDRPVTGVQSKYRKLVSNGVSGAYLE